VAWIDVPLDAAHFDGPGGEPAWYRSSERAQRGFCLSCGGTVFYRSGGGVLLGITTASLDEPDRFPPVKWSHKGSAPVWLPPLLGNRT